MKTIVMDITCQDLSLDVYHMAVAQLGFLDSKGIE
jgi:hypothetical protein